MPEGAALSWPLSDIVIRRKNGFAFRCRVRGCSLLDQRPVSALPRRRRERYRQTTSLEGVKIGSRSAVKIGSRLTCIGKALQCHNVMLSAETLDLLRQWWMARRSRHDGQTPVQECWLFRGTRPGRPMTTRQLNRLFHQAADNAGLKKGVTLHAQRHSFARQALSLVQPNEKTGNVPVNGLNF